MDQDKAIQIPGLVTLCRVRDGVPRNELSPSPRRMDGSVAALAARTG